ncbi:MAG: hypothetical protein JWL95_2834 [Gemmatimonadetes bacterium]|nr:hypothetical protein [Gemmatimonadota bacterium]
MDQRLSVITLGVHDIARSRQFYENGLGWHRDAGEDDVAFYQTGSFITALYEWPKLAADAQVPAEGTGFRGVALGYCTRSRAEVDVVMARAEASGARVAVAARDTFWGGYAGYFADPDGHLWEIAWNPGWTLGADGSMSLRPPA